MPYILIAMMSYGSAPAITSIEFNNKLFCDRAVVELKKHWRTKYAECFKKGLPIKERVR